MFRRISKFFERYGGEFGQNNYKVRDAVEDIISRSTIRNYDVSKKIPEELFQKLICAAQSAPTSSMAQAWSVISIKDIHTKRALLYDRQYALHLGILKNKELFSTDPNPENSNKTPDFQNRTAIETCDRLLIWLVDMSKLQTVFTNGETGSADHIKSVKKSASTDGINLMNFQLRSIIDTAIAAQTFAICAELQGLGVMYAGGFRTMDLKELLNLPDYVMPLFGMTIGYPTTMVIEGRKIPRKPDIKARMPQDMMVHYERYKPISLDRLKSYNMTLKETVQYYDKYDWFDRMITRTLPNGENVDFNKLAAMQGYRFK